MTEATEQSSSEDNYLKKLLDDKNIRQHDLADRIQTSRVAVNQVVNDKRGITPLMALKLEAALGVPAKDILETQSIVALDKAYKENKDVIETIRNNPMITEANGGGQA